MSTFDLKTQICNALANFIRQKPGLEYGNYGDRTSYNAEKRGIERDLRDAEKLLLVVRHIDAITAEDLIEAARQAFAGRLEIIPAGVESLYEYPKTADTLRIGYCTGQYWPTEYRKAAAAVLANVLWNYARANMPKPEHEDSAEYPGGSYEGMSAGAWLRQHFRKEFGSRMQKRWFD